ncbi:hypothetical protein [Marinobacter sp. X15-166B]|uniref:hypothetical protein n=1 Tax=Marinobacter sp. X15-166B TaxID=1897620 RepID=UPI00085C372C|nr:hypothetical protein [Marinobacter sp. X15-166B]OEY67436.1 hypothetical protein BG841_14015 [Marinobacter sp. X15-166B]
MARKPKRRKNHSAAARDQRLFANSRVWTWEGLVSPDNGQKYTTAERLLPFGWVDMGDDLAQHLVKRPRNWLVAVRALCRAPDGVSWMESRYFDLPSYSIQQVAELYHELRADALKAQRTAQVYDMGWICQTWHGKKPDDPLELWHYQYAPAEAIRQVTNDEKLIARMAGPGYSQERYDRWQQVNVEYLEERKRELEKEKAA